MRFREDVAYEYLDDGGVLACYLPEGEYWRLGPPVGKVWAAIAAGQAFEDVQEVLAAAVDASPEEAAAGLEALCESLQVMSLLEPGWRSAGV